MKKLFCIKDLYLYHITKAQDSSYHRQVYEILCDAGFMSQSEIAALMNQYSAAVLEMEDCVGISHKLDSTDSVTNTWNVAEQAFKGLVNELRNLKYSTKKEVAERFPVFYKVELKGINFNVCRKSNSERMTALMSFVSHLRSDWMELIEAAGLTERLEALEAALEKHNEVYVLHIEEMAAVDKGRVKRVRKELENIYQVLMFYVQAWANTPDEGESPENVAKFEAARDVVSRVNKLISDLNHSLSVAKSNRRRAKKKAEAEVDGISQETEID